MLQRNFAKSWFIRLLLLTIATIFWGLPLSTSYGKTAHPVVVHLVDDNGYQIAHIKLMARLIGGKDVQGTGHTARNGSALFNLPLGKYYFTGDVSALHSKVSYSTNLKNNYKTMYYFISQPIEITEKTQDITLAINSMNYMDVADIAGLQGFKLHVNQSELGINTNIYVKNHYKWVRLYLPMRKTYTFANIEGIFHIKWPVYATPGMQFVISST